MAGQRRLRDLVAQVKLDTTPAEQAMSRVQGTLFKTSTSSKQLQGGLAAINAEFSRMGPLGSLAGSSLGNLGNLFPSLSGKLELHAAQWGLLGTKAQSAAYGLTGAETEIARSEGALSNLGAAVPAVAAGVVAIGAAFEVARSGVDAFVTAAEPVHKLELVTGATAEQASVLSYSFKQLGIDGDYGGQAIFRLGKNIETAGPKLEAMGVSIAHNRDGSVDLLGTLNSLSDAYASNGDYAQRDALLVQAFGRGGSELAPLLAQGSAGLKDFTEQAKAAGLVFNQQQIEQAHEYALATNKLGLEFEGLKTSLGEGVIPLFQELADDASKVAQGIQAVGDHVPQLGKGLQSAAELVVGPLAPLLGLLNQLPGGTKAAAAGESALSGQMAELSSQAAEQAKALEDLYGGYVSGAQATLAYGNSQQTIGGQTDEYLQKQLNVKIANQAVKDAQTALTAAIQGGAPKAARANQELALAQDALNKAVLKYGQNSPQALAASIRVGDAQNALNKAINAYGPGSEAAAKASDDLTAAQLRARGAARDLAGDLSQQEGEVLNTALAYVAQQKALAEAEGAQFTAKDSAEALITGLEAVRKELDPNNPLYQNLSGWIDQLENGIPKEVTTQISAVYKDYSSGGPGGTSQVGHFAAGGDYPAYRPRITGEYGPELDVPMMPGHVFNAADTASLLRNASAHTQGDSRSYQVQINNPVPVPSEASIVSALLRASFLAGD